MEYGSRALARLTEAPTTFRIETGIKNPSDPTRPDLPQQTPNPPAMAPVSRQAELSPLRTGCSIDVRDFCARPHGLLLSHLEVHSREHPLHVDEHIVRLGSALHTD